MSGGKYDDQRGRYKSRSLLLDGRKGGQTANGGRDSGDDLTLRSTSHATKGTIFLADDGGDIKGGDNAQFVVEAGGGANTLVVDSNSRVGVGTASPGVQLHVYHATDDITAKVETDKTDGDVLLKLTNDAQEWELRVRGQVSDALYIRNSTAGTVPMRIETGASDDTLVVDTNSRVGIGTNSPDSIFQIKKSGVGGFGVWGYAGLDGTRRTIVANGSDDVTNYVSADYAAHEVTAGNNVGGRINIANGGNSNVTVGTTTINFRVNADGSFDVARTAGTDTVDVMVSATWV